MSYRELGLLLLVCLVWGFHFVVMKMVVGVLPPMLYAAFRMAIVAIVLSPFLRWRTGEMKYVFAGGLCLGAINYASMFTGMKFATASAAAIAIELNVPFATILAMIFLGDRPGLPRLAGIALAFAGVAVIAVGRQTGVGDHVGIGIGLVAIAAFCEALGAVIVKRTISFKPHELLAWFAVVGGIALSTMSALFETGQAAAFAAVDKWFLAGSLFYSAIGSSVFAHTIYYWLLQRLPVSMVAPSALFTTVIAVFSGVLVLHDPINTSMIAGGLMTLVGVGIVILRNLKKQATIPVPLEM
ncbi:MAG: DMT family transporter [Parvularculaceae bacterium]